MRCRRERFEQGANRSRVGHPARICNADRGVHAGNPEGMNLSARMAALSFLPGRPVRAASSALPCTPRGSFALASVVLTGPSACAWRHDGCAVKRGLSREQIPVLVARDRADRRRAARQPQDFRDGRAEPLLPSRCDLHRQRWRLRSGRRGPRAGAPSGGDSSGVHAGGAWHIRNVARTAVD